MDHSRYFNQSSIQAANLRLHYLTQLLREQTGSIVQYGILRGFSIGIGDWAEVGVGRLPAWHLRNRRLRHS